MPRGSVMSVSIAVVAFSVAVFVWWSSGLAKAAETSITATVVETRAPVEVNPIVQFVGIAAPAATVTIKRGGLLAASSTADSQAAFSSTLVDQPTGQQTYVVAAQDENGKDLAPLTFALDLKGGTTTIITGIFLGPSIEVDKPTAKLGETVNVLGFTAPLSKVTLAVTSTKERSYTVETDSVGKWTKGLATNEVGVGNHLAKARSVTADSIVSAFSAEVSFVVNPRDPAEGKKSSDINTDSHVNLIDFSILLFYWKQKNPANPRADINRDGIVDIVDFSILLYQWDGK